VSLPAEGYIALPSAALRLAEGTRGAMGRQGRLGGEDPARPAVTINTAHQPQL
jgi:hypothetical protein